MKKQNLKFINFIGKDEMDNLTHIVKETVSEVINECKKLTTADLWNIQRNYKTTISRRCRYSLN
jgi:hypothetical protein